MRQHQAVRTKLDLDDDQLLPPESSLRLSGVRSDPLYLSLRTAA